VDGLPRYDKKYSNRHTKKKTPEKKRQIETISLSFYIKKEFLYKKGIFI
jgi:hypothetical protein